MSYLLFLDDIRQPSKVYPATIDGDWIICRTYLEFEECVKTRGVPNFVSFDHDLAEEHYRPSMYTDPSKYTGYYSDGTFKEKTGYDAAKYLMMYCANNRTQFPQWRCHSMNPVGKQNIEQLLSRA